MPPSSSPPPQPNFDRVARVYRWAEYLTLGPLLQQTRLALLDCVSGCRQALLFGDGDGRFLAHLLARSPELHATAVDTSPAMLRLLWKRCERRASTATARLTLRCCSALDAPPPPTTDLIVTHFFLDCLSQPEVECLVQKVAAAVQPGTLWLLSDFEVPPVPLLRGAARLYIRSLYAAFRALTGLHVRQLPNPQAALARCGFQRLVRRRKVFGLLYAEVWVLRGTESLRSSVSDESHNPLMPDHIHKPMASPPEAPGSPAGIRASKDPAADPLPNPEPIAPSLDEPDPGVFHHEPGHTPPPGAKS